MNPEQLYDGMTEIRDDLIEEPVSPRKPEPKKPWVRWLLSAAAILTVIFLGSLVGGKAGGGSGNGGRTYMAYHGPVFPLDVLEDTALTASRRTDYDFSPMTGEIDHSYVDQYGETITYQYGGYEVIVTDSYTLTNDTDRDVTVTAVYPFASHLDDELRRIPRVTVDGAAADTELAAGRSDWDLHDGSWENYAALLADGTYQTAALGGGLTLDTPVVVYELTDLRATAVCTEPTIQFSAELPEGSVLLSYGARGGIINTETGGTVRRFTFPGKSSERFRRCVLIVGEDLTDYTVEGYANSLCEPGSEVPLEYRVERYETTLSEMLHRFYVENRGFTGEKETVMDCVSAQAYLGIIGEYIAQYGLTAVPDLSEVYLANTKGPGGERVFYSVFSLTVPAHGQTEVSIAMHKRAHTDYTGRGAQRQGYDLVTQLGSSLTFTGQLASISNFENFTILRQNFGFDPKHGVTTVLLDPKVDHYWMDVRKQ